MERPEVIDLMAVLARSSAIVFCDLGMNLT